MKKSLIDVSEFWSTYLKFFFYQQCALHKRCIGCSGNGLICEKQAFNSYNLYQSNPKQMHLK